MLLIFQIGRDDSPAQLAGKQVNVYLYKDGKYSRILKQFAPTVFENVAEKFNEDDVKYWKGRAEKYFTDYVKPKLEEDTGGSDSFVSSTETNKTDDSESTTSTDEPIPF